MMPTSHAFERPIILLRGIPIGQDPFLLEMPFLINQFPNATYVFTHKSPQGRVEDMHQEVSTSQISWGRALFALASPKRLLEGRYWKGLKAILKTVFRQRAGLVHATRSRKFLKAYSTRFTQILLSFSWAYSRTPPSLVYSFTLSPVLVGFRCAWPSTRIVARAVGNDALPEQTGIPFLPFQDSLIESLDRIMCVSGSVRDQLILAAPDATERISVNYLGIRSLSLAPAPAESEPIRVLSISRIDTNKRVGLLLEGIRELSTSGFSVHWTHVGTGPEFDDLLSRANETLTPSEYSFLGRVSSSDLRNLLEERPFHVFAHLAASEGLPLVVVEAQSVGLPVIATDAGGTFEGLCPVGNIRLAKYPTPEDIAAGIKAAARTREDHSVERREFALEHFCPERNYADLLATLNRTGDI